MQGTRGKSSLAAYAVALALLAVIGVAGCSGQAAPVAAGSPSPASAAPAAVVIPATLKWSAASAPLPVNARGLSDQLVTLGDISCPKAGDCVAVGNARARAAGGDGYQGLTETLSGGTWTAAAVPDVSNAQGFAAALTGVSCPAPGTCVAVGYIGSSPSLATPVIETLADGRWHPVTPPLPDDATTSSSSILTDVACPAAGACVATGYYSNQDDAHDGFIETLANGTWTAASAILPQDAAPEKAPSRWSTLLNFVSCTAVGQCVAAGQYQDKEGQIRPFIETLSAGAQSATAVPLPADAATTGQTAGLWSIDCPAAGNCVAGGDYIERGGRGRFLVDTLSGGNWTALGLHLPPDAAAVQQQIQYGSTTIRGLACASIRHCVASAVYSTKGSPAVSLIGTLSGGTWTAASAPLPAGAARGSGLAKGVVSLYSVACSALVGCVTIGTYEAADGTGKGLIETAAPGRG